MVQPRWWSGGEQAREGAVQHGRGQGVWRVGHTLQLHQNCYCHWLVLLGRGLVRLFFIVGFVGRLCRLSIVVFMCVFVLGVVSVGGEWVFFYGCFFIVFFVGCCWCRVGFLYAVFSVVSEQKLLGVYCWKSHVLLLLWGICVGFMAFQWTFHLVFFGIFVVDSNSLEFCCLVSCWVCCWVFCWVCC